MEFEKNLMCDIIANFMKIVDDYSVCYCDKYDRKRSSIFINWDYVNFINIRTFNFDSLFINEMKKNIEGLVVIDSNDKYTIFEYKDCHIAMCHTIDSDLTNSDISFTKLDYPRDIRGFEKI